tara:strand:+ start:1389 stop:1757 length:369 start_codon:yes stop_codon:yes gene_type:complete
MKINPIEQIANETENTFGMEDVFTNIMSELEKLRKAYVKAILYNKASPNYEEMLKDEICYDKGTILFSNYVKFLEEELAFHKNSKSDSEWDQFRKAKIKERQKFERQMLESQCKKCCNKSVE